MKKLLLLIILMTYARVLLFSQHPTPGFVKDSLDIYIKRALRKWNMPGVAVAIVKDGKVILVKGYGKQSMARKDSVDENTLFLIGSNTKAFTATILSWLNYEKKCTLDDKVVKWLPDFRMKDPWVTKELDLTDILCHRIGMETFQGDFMYWTSDLTKTQVIEKFGQLTPVYDFRRQWGYTNAGFLIAGECIQKISNDSWESNVRNRILVPLQMNRTRALTAEMPLQKNIAEPHTLVFDTLKLIPCPSIDNLAPAASISSSASDMSHWLICLLDSGKYNGKQVIPFSVIRDTRKPRSIVGNPEFSYNRTHFNVYGLGWELSDYEGSEIVSHTGGVNGFVSSVTLLPEEKLGVVVLTNTDQNYFYESLKWEIVDAYLNLPYRDYSDDFLRYFKRANEMERYTYKAQRDTIAMHKKPPTDLKNFTGRYINPVYGYLDIKKAGELLTINFEHHPNLKGKLEYMDGNRFLCTYNDPTFGIKVIPFELEKDKVISMQLKVADFIEFTSYEFVKQ